MGLDRSFDCVGHALSKPMHFAKSTHMPMCVPYGGAGLAGSTGDTLIEVIQKNSKHSGLQAS